MVALLLRWLRNNSFFLTLISLSFLCVALAGVAHADVKGIPYNDRFQTASFPYARVIDSCTDWQRPEAAGDGWGVVSFSGACQIHDRCYHTPGARWGDCNQRFLEAMRATCDRDLEQARLAAGRLGKADGQAVQLCYAIADVYFARVQRGEVVQRFDFAQKQAAAYLSWVREAVNDIYRAVLRRDATKNEKNQALIGLSKDFSLADLKTALLGHKLDLPPGHVDSAADLGGEDIKIPEVSGI